MYSPSNGKVYCYFCDLFCAIYSVLMPIYTTAGKITVLNVELKTENKNFRSLLPRTEQMNLT
jgi:hypothetical protein